MNSATRKRKWAARIVAGCILSLALAPIALYGARHALVGEYRTIWRPDGKYKIVVYSYPMLFAMPGQSGDASGFVRLYDSQGRVLEEQEVDMVQNIDQVYWEDEKVDIKLFAEWALPSP